MGYVEILPSYFIHGQKSIWPDERDFIERHYPTTKTLEGGVFFHENLHTNYYISRAPKEKAIVVGCAGLNSHFILGSKDIGKLKEAGITLIWMTLPPAIPGKPFIKNAEKLFRVFATDKNSPARILSHSDVPRYLASHSTGGAIVLNLLHEPETRAKLKHIFSGAAYVAPFIDIPYASRDHSLTIKGRKPLYWLFERVSTKHSNERVSDLSIVKKYLSLTAKNENFVNDAPDISPTFAQIREIKNYSLSMVDRFDPDAAGALPSLIMTGNKDPFTCYKTTHAIAQKMNAEFFLARGAGHDPLRDNPELLDVFINKLDECAQIHTHKREQAVYVPHRREVEEFEELPELPVPLRDRARLALKSGARFLNSAACLF